MDDFAKTVPSYFQYWGKARKDPQQVGADYHLLAYHCLDVAAMGKLLLDIDRPLTKDLADLLEITPSQVQGMMTFMLALHDLGKFASAFQALYVNSDNNLLKPDCRKQYEGSFYRHDRMGLYFWEYVKTDLLTKFVKDNGDLDVRARGESLDTLMVLVDCVLGHHGQPIDTANPKSIKDFTQTHNLNAAMHFTLDLLELLKPEFPLEKLQSKEWRRRLEQVSWQLAGMAVLADWIGSDSQYFQYQSTAMPLVDYWDKAQQIAQMALAATDLHQQPKVQPFLSIQTHYGFEPTPLQQWAESVPVNDSPQLFILEDVTGSGKTEAALALTHRLMEAGAAEGFYFGLPTMATSNAMFGRVASHYRQMLTDVDGKPPCIVLAHGARDMNTLFRESVLASGLADANYDNTDVTATAQCNQWLADSRKKALLAPVGVGTIDQALLAVLPRRHQSLRLLGLNRKVLVFDEVHAADEFMFELLESLLALHFYQGGSAILLTATLSLKQRQRLTDIWLNAGGFSPQRLQQTAFPLATKVSQDFSCPVLEQPLTSRADVSREVSVDVLNRFESCIDTVLTAVAKGQCVVWVRNTVNDALEAYLAIQGLLQQSDDCLLFHSRFVLQDRKDIEDRVLSIFGKLSNNAIRWGKVLIATQVFQESLDADADLMISDICPIDDLIQRAGRLHRHTRNSDMAYQAGIIDSRPSPKLFVHAPEWDEQPSADWLSKAFKNTQYVYRSPGRLWLGLRELHKLGSIRMPHEARQLIEAVYSDAASEQIPANLRHQENECIGDERSKAAKAKSQLLQWQAYGYCDRSAINRQWYEDNTDISTRYSDIETVEVLLLRQTQTGLLQPWVGAKQFALQLSTLKLSKNKYADKLATVPEHLAPALQAFTQQYPQSKYLHFWLPQLDPNFTYHPTTGFCEKESPR